jgi:hypothetical protein
MCVYSTARGPALSVARPRRVPRPRATSRRPVTHTHNASSARPSTRALFASAVPVDP